MSLNADILVELRALLASVDEINGDLGRLLEATGPGGIVTQRGEEATKSLETYTNLFGASTLAEQSLEVPAAEASPHDT